MPETWDEYMKQVEFFTRDTDGDGQTDFYGVVNQGLRPDPIAMEWSNYLYANGGQYYDEGTWKPMLDTPEAAQALERLHAPTSEVRAPRRRELRLRRGVQRRGPGQGVQLHHLQHVPHRLRRSRESAVVGKMEIAAVPNGGLNGAWGWAIPKSSPDPEAAWTFLKWIESPEIAKKRALLGGSPTRTDVFEDAELLAKYEYYPALRNLLETSRNFPVFTYTPQFVEVLGPRAVARRDRRKGPAGRARHHGRRSSRTCCARTAS